MRIVKLFWSIILVFSLGLVFATFPEIAKGQGKTIGASGSGDKDKKNTNTNTTGNKPKIIGATGAKTDTDTAPTKATPAIPPPPPPSLSRIVVVVPKMAIDAEVLVNGKVYKVDSEGATKYIDIKPGPANIVIKHPDFEPFKETVELEKGKGITKIADLVSKYGDIKLGGIPENAQIFIDDKEIPKESLVITKGEDSLPQVSIKHVLVGSRKLKITHPDYITRDESIEIKSGEELTDAKGLILATADLNLSSTPGAEVYIDGESKGKVLPNGTIVVNLIKPGEREIRIVKDGYEEKKILEKLAIGPKDLAVKLVPIPNSGEFFEPFNNGLKLWDAPSDWKVDEKSKLIVQGSSKLGFPKGGIFRDLDGGFALKMINGKGIAWALKVNNSAKNYYLFYLSGPKGKTPNVLRTYICQDGKFDVSNFARSVKVNTVTLSPDYFYRVRITVRGNKIETFITPNQGPEAGTEQPIDVFIDENNTFSYGNIAFSTVDGEEAMIDDVAVKPVETAEEKAAREQKASK
jgi:hypothetical protein